MESFFELRCKSKHLDHCNLLEHDETSTEDRHHYSLVYGVNRRALLTSLRFFDVASGTLIPDIMHDILEGALPLVVKQMLKVCDNNYACTSFMSLMLRYLLLKKRCFHLTSLMNLLAV